MARRSEIFRANLPRGWESGREGESYERRNEVDEEVREARRWSKEKTERGKKRKPLLRNVKKQLLSRYNAA